MLRTILLRTAQFKGELTVDAAAAATSASQDTVGWYLWEMADNGLLRGEESYTLTPAGRFALRLAIEVESNQAPSDQLVRIHQRYSDFSAEFDQFIVDWQRDPEQTPQGLSASALNQATDRLIAFHEDFLPLVGEVVECAERLHPYPSRFAHAIDLARGGDLRYVDIRAVDSYLTVWCEFHEELLGLLHLDFSAGTLAGRAA